jgi:AraC family transcriptional regulator
MTINAFRESLRVRAALQQLIDTTTPVIDIALGVGFASQSHFTDTFRRHFQMTPARARRRMRDPIACNPFNARRRRP